MNTLYDSESFAVVHLLTPLQDTPTPQGLQMAHHGFEIVDKRSGKEVYLDGSWAELFQKQLSAWQAQAPTQDEVEATLEQFSGLAQQPVVLH